jgi:hypothetical protein
LGELGFLGELVESNPILSGTAIRVP